MSDNTMMYLFLGFAVFSALYICISLSMRNFRLRLVDIAEELLADKSLSRETKDDINHLIDTCMSYKVAFFLPLAALASAADTILGINHPTEELDDDERYHDLVGRYFVSVIAANLIFAPVAILSVLLFGLVDLLFGRNSKVEFVEQPALRASHAVSY